MSTLIQRITVFALLCLSAHCATTAMAEDNSQVNQLLLDRFDENRDGKLDIDEGLAVRSRLRHLLLDESDRKIIIEDWRDDVRGILESFDESRDGKLDVTEKKRAQADIGQLLPEFQPRKSDARRSTKTETTEPAAKPAKTNRESNNRQSNNRMGYANQNFWGRGYGNSPMNSRFGRYGSAYGNGYGGNNYGYGANRFGNNRDASMTGTNRAAQRSNVGGLARSGRFNADPVRPSRESAGENQGRGFSFPGINDVAESGFARSELSVPDRSPFREREFAPESGPIDEDDAGDALSEDYEQVADTESGSDTDRDRKKKTGVGRVNYNPTFNPKPSF